MPVEETGIQIADVAPPERLNVLVLTCPPASTSGLASDIRSRGNCPLEVAGTFLAELPARSLRESWAEARRLSSRDAGKLAGRLAQSLNDADAGHDLDSMLAEAAALFLATLRQNNVSPRQATRGCRITWHHATGQSELEYLS